MGLVIDESIPLYNKTLLELVNGVHKALSDHSNWEYKPLSPGMFGFDNICESIAAFTEHYDISTRGFDRDLARLSHGSSTVQKELSSADHQGWAKNYIHWRDNKPWETDEQFKNPFRPLGDENRNKLAEMHFLDLPKEERDKDLVIAKYLLSLL